ncbi:PiggyBac transposable element-derived protein 4 [Eumeta japonica]|uniref:PiggyBac transposable element-derived protein 4 n=1 Tax=Eumeta variegata TaxID=151549 RepID=A0A4C1UCA5_EUMVA|nr:PiggyBac transposable element-derived protein 4 [Eumeta japonica]
MTLDEQLLAFRGRCAFRQYIPNKPAKYGIKVFALVDVYYPYTFNLEIYAGQQPEGPFRLSNERHDVVMRMARPVLGKHLNITMDNWFSSQRVAKQLFENGTTMIGTMRRDKREVPCEFRVARENPLFSSKFGFNQPCTLVSYVAKPNRVVILMSTMHNDTAIDSDTGDRQKPEIITYYNRTKNGVDLVDKMCSLYDVSRNSRRWPATVFYDLLNLSALNALCIYTANKNYESVRRRDFLVDLSLAWMKPLANRRLETKTLPRSLTFKIKDFLGIIHTENESTASTSPPSKSVRRCHDCGRARTRGSRSPRTLSPSLSQEQILYLPPRKYILFEKTHQSWSSSRLHPLLYSSHTNDVPRSQTDVQLALFADDTALYQRGINFKNITPRLQTAIDELTQWFQTWRIECLLMPTQRQLTISKYYTTDSAEWLLAHPGTSKMVFSMEISIFPRS